MSEETYFSWFYITKKNNAKKIIILKVFNMGLESFENTRRLQFIVSISRWNLGIMLNYVSIFAIEQWGNCETE